MRSPGPLLSLRAAVILLAAVVTGIVAGVLVYLEANSIPAAVAIGGSAVGATIQLLNKVVSD